MNQKLRTARSSIVILLAILGIVCLSLGLFFTAPFVSFAEDNDAEGFTTLDYLDADENALWIVHYGEDGQAKLLDGADENGALYYLENVYDDQEMRIEIRKGTVEQKNMFTPYRAGESLTIALNPEYLIPEVGALGQAYDLTNAIYDKPTASGSASASTSMTTIAEVPAVDGGDALKLQIQWTIATLCSPLTLSNNNTILEEDYVYVTTTEREYLSSVNFNELRPYIGDAVVYNFIETETHLETSFAIKYNGVNGSYYNAEKIGDNEYNLSSSPIDTSSIDGKYLNYIARKLPAGNYELNITTVPYTTDDGVYYAPATRSMGSFTVKRVSLGDGSQLDSSKFTVDVPYAHVDYTGIVNNTPNITLKLNGFTLEAGVDYNLTSTSINVGMGDLTIVGEGSLEGTYVIHNAFQIDPARNDWEELPGIHPWTYGTYDASIHKIVGKPVYYSEDLSDITFQIVRINSQGEEEIIEGLDAIHFEKLLTGDGENAVEEWLLPLEVEQLLASLHVGQYRLIASVEGSYPGEDITENTKNHQPITPRSIDFEVYMGINKWGDTDDAIPSIVAWTQGKFDSEKNVITAVPAFGNAIIFIRNSANEIIYSTSPDHAELGLGDIEILKNLKKGTYSLQAIVEATGDYSGLNTSIFFEIAANGLPAWAVALIVLASLGIVALVFSILHQKGVLQMLTGRVLLAMRTKANVDATLAAIRAAKIAREAEISIAQAKARDAEEAKKAEEANKDK